MPVTTEQRGHPVTAVADAAADAPIRGRTADAPRTWMRRLGFAWLVAMAALLLFEPAPSNPNASEPAWAVATFAGFLGALVAMATGIRLRRRWAFGASAVAGALGMLIAYACLQSGHHLGAWWMIELATFGGLTALSITAAERSRA